MSDEVDEEIEISWWESLKYRLFGYWIRREACRLAAQSVQGAWTAQYDVASLVWSLTVFYEHYLHVGCKGTQADFGPKEPVNLSIIRGPAVIPRGMQSPKSPA